MTDADRARSAPRARPLADLPLEVLGERTEELARRWAITLVSDRSLHGLTAIPLEQIAHEAPELCGQLLRALGSDAELDLLAGVVTGSRGRGNVAARLGALAGATDVAGVIEAVEALRGVIWEALLAELEPAVKGAPPRRIIDAADRLAHICAAMLPAALAGLGGEEHAAVHEEPGGQPSQGAEVAVTARVREPSPAARIVIVDERVQARQPAQSADAHAYAPIAAPEPSGADEIEVRDERREEGPAAWIGSIGSQLERFAEDRLPFAVLLLEVSHERFRAGLEEILESALMSTLRESSSGGSLTRERAGRYWLLAPRTDRSGASDLAGRLTLAVEAAGAAHGVETSAAVGMAVCPQDGRQASSLAAHADIGLYAARSRASGLEAAPIDERG